MNKNESDNKPQKTKEDKKKILSEKLRANLQRRKKPKKKD